MGYSFCYSNNERKDKKIKKIEKEAQKFEKLKLSKYEKRELDVIDMLSVKLKEFYAFKNQYNNLQSNAENKIKNFKKQITHICTLNNKFI